MRRQQPPGHFGLPGMRERAAIVGDDSRSAARSVPARRSSCGFRAQSRTGHPRAHRGRECPDGRTVIRDSAGCGSPARPSPLARRPVGLYASITVNAYQRISTRTLLSALRNCVRTVSHTPPNPWGKHRHLRGHAEADRCCGKSLIGSALVRFGVRQHARRESISKRARSTHADVKRDLPAANSQRAVAPGRHRFREIADPQPWMAGNLDDRRQTEMELAMTNRPRRWISGRIDTPDVVAVASVSQLCSASLFANAYVVLRLHVRLLR